MKRARLHKIITPDRHPLTDRRAQVRLAGDPTNPQPGEVVLKDKAQLRAAHPLSPAAASVCLCAAQRKMQRQNFSSPASDLNPSFPGILCPIPQTSRKESLCFDLVFARATLSQTYCSVYAIPRW